MHKLFKLTPQFLQVKRKASTFYITEAELEVYVQKIIFILEMNGDKYFNCSKVLMELIETQGFPDRKNKEELRLFKDCFLRVAKRYEMYPNHMNNYSFKLKQKKGSILYSFKRLLP
jgi:hypothetical protein